MTSLFPPFNRRSSFRKQPYFYEAGRGVNYKSTGGPFPTLDLNFLSGTLDPRITFSRASNATLTDSTGKITYAPNNLLLQSQAWATSPWATTVGGVAATPTVTNNYASAPDGTATATRLQLSLNGGTTTTDLALVRQSATFTSGLSLFSFYAKSNDGNSYVCQIINPDGAGSNITITNTWQRFTSSILTATGSVNYGIRLRGGQSPANSNTADILVWGAQLEAVTYQTTPSTYNATTTAAYYGPRFDYDPVTLAAKGLLIEEARTNLALQSQTLDSATWTKNGSSITANATTAPDGTLTADLWVPTTSGNITSTRLLQMITVASATAYTATVYVKAFGRRWVYFSGPDATSNNYNCWFDLQNGVVGTKGANVTSATITNVGSGWYRLSVTSTSTVTTNYMFVSSTDADNSTTVTANSVDGLYVWGAQLEAGAFATSYIPTVAASVARSADIATMTGTNFSSWFNQGPVNLALQSQTLENASWTNVSATVTANAAVAPDGTTTAEKLIDSVTNTGHGVAQGVATISGTRYVQSIYAKASERSWMYLTEGNNVTATAYFDLVNGVVGTVTGTGSPSATITSVGNGWYRCSMAFTPISTTSNIQPRVTTGNNVYTYAGDGTSGIFLWGAQLEVGSTATTYIPTTTVPVASPPAVGTFSVKGDVITQFASNKEFFTIADAGATNLFRLSADNTNSRPQFTVVTGGVTQANLFNTSFTLTANTPYTTAQAFATDDLAMSTNGSAVNTDTSVQIPAVSLFYIGSNVGANRYLNGHLQYIKYYNQRLPNAKLQALTI